MAGANKDKEITTLLKNNAGFNDDAVNTWFWIKEYESMLKEFYGIDNFPYEMYSFYLSKDLKPSSEIEMSKINEYIQNFSNLQFRQQFLQKYSEIKHFLQTIPFELEQCLDYLRDYDIIKDPMYNYYKKKISNIVEPKNRNSSMKHNYDYMNKSATLVALYKFWQSFPNKSEIIDGIELFERVPHPQSKPLPEWAEFYKSIRAADKAYNKEQRRSSSSTPSPINKIRISPEGKRAQPDYSRTGSGLAKALKQHEVKQKIKKKQRWAASIGINNRLRDLRNADRRILRQRTDSSGWSEYGSDDRDSPPLLSGTAADARFVPRPSPSSRPLREASPPASDTCGPSGCMIMGGKRKTKRKYRKRRPIKINKKMKGVFTRKAKKHRMSVQKYARYVIKKFKGKTKNKKQLKLLRQAVFAKTAKKWKKRNKNKTNHKKR
jgi:hypothetical protein